MEIIKINIQDVLIIEPHVFKDSRGYSFESSPKENSMRSVSERCRT